MTEQEAERRRVTWSMMIDLEVDADRDADPLEVARRGLEALRDDQGLADISVLRTAFAVPKFGCASWITSCRSWDVDLANRTVTSTDDQVEREPEKIEVHELGFEEPVVTFIGKAWKGGDPCGVCGSKNTYGPPGGCRDCGASDADE